MNMLIYIILICDHHEVTQVWNHLSQLRSWGTLMFNSWRCNPNPNPNPTTGSLWGWRKLKNMKNLRHVEQHLSSLISKCIMEVSCGRTSERMISWRRGSHTESKNLCSHFTEFWRRGGEWFNSNQVTTVNINTLSRVFSATCFLECKHSDWRWHCCSVYYQGSQEVKGQSADQQTSDQPLNTRL